MQLVQLSSERALKTAVCNTCCMVDFHNTREAGGGIDLYCKNFFLFSLQNVSKITDKKGGGEAVLAPYLN